MTDPRFPSDPPRGEPDDAAERRPEVSLPPGFRDRYAGGPLPERPPPVERAEFAIAGREARSAPATREATWTWTLYALILFAIPTLGLSALIGLYGVMTRPASDDPVLGSHERFQARTLRYAAMAGVAGVVLIVVNLGILVLFLTALWTLARGLAGVWRLRQDRPIPNPSSWTI